MGMVSSEAPWWAISPLPSACVSTWSTLSPLLRHFFFYFFHQFLYWVLQRGLLGAQTVFDVQHTLVLGLMNAIVGLAVFHFLDKLRERV